jgi:CRP-like cAMP-binding protein
LYEGVNRYAQAFLGSVMQSTACMSLHSVHERCCRWLLMTHDRVGRDHFELSHEFLAMMLGTARPTVSLVASALQEAGLIRYSYGRITITNRAGLEAASCDCYAITRDLFAGL